jgi:enoyl-CoA hydratase
MPEVHVNVDGHVATVTIDDATRRNALTVDLVDEIVATFDALEAGDTVAAIIVTGAPPAFCAGADLSDLGASQEKGLRYIYDGFMRVARSRIPTIAAVNGAAVGAGMNLALACDIRIAARSARFDSRFLQLGIHPGGGHTWMLQRAIGPQATNMMVLAGEILDGEAAERAGLAWRCVADDALLIDAGAIADRVASAPPELVRRTKRTLQDVASLDAHEAAVDRELQTQLWSMGQPAFAERLAAMQKRIGGDKKNR